MKNYGDLAISPNAADRKANRFEITITNCGFYCAYNSPFHYSLYEDDYLLIYLTKGTMTVMLDGKKQLVESGSVVIHPVKVRSDITYNNDSVNERYYIYFGGNRAEEILKKLNLTKNVIKIGHSPEFLHIFQKLFDDFRETNTNYSLHRSILLLELLSTIKNLSTPKTITETPKSNISPAIMHIRSNIDKPPLSIEEYSRMCFLSSVSFIKNFKKSTGQTPYNYIISLKMHAAQTHLIFSNTPVNKIAESLGYDDPLYFSKQFKKFVGVSPLNFRKEHGTEGNLQNK